MEALTDNRNRTAADLRAALSKRGGNLGETGCVSWMFTQKGVCIINGQIDEDLLLVAALDGGADIYELIDDEEQPGAEVFTETTNLEQLSQTLQAQGFAVMESEWRWIPGNTVEITDPDHSKQLLKLLETLEELDDIQNVTANFEMSADLINLSMN